MQNLIKICLVSLFASILACGPLYDPNGYNHIIHKSKDAYSEIIAFPVISDTDTTLINELRFYHIASSLDSQRIMYHYYGKWSGRYEGKHNERVTQLIWENIPLLNDENRFTIIADGTETRTEYFTSFMVFDANSKDCLVYSNPKKEDLVNHLIDLMKSDTWHDSDFFDVKN